MLNLAFGNYKAQHSQDAERNYYANYGQVKNEIFERAEEFLLAYAFYYNIKVNRRQDSPKRLNDVRTALRRLTDTIKPKLIKYGNEAVKKMCDEIDSYEMDMALIPFQHIIGYKNTIIDWMETSGLKKIEIEQQNLLDQIESECYDNS